MAILASCICPTFGRFPDYGHLLCEAVESFVRQTLPAPQRELLILNDDPTQLLVLSGDRRYANENIRIFNAGHRYATLGAKYNFLIQQAKGAVIFPWEDDDISLPGRLRQGIGKTLGSKCKHQYFNPRYSWFFAARAAGPEGEGWHWSHPQGVNHNASCYTKSAIIEVGGYQLRSGPQDKHADIALRRLCQRPEFSRAGCSGIAAPLTPDPRDWTYIYRWGVSNMHLSGFVDTEAAYRDHGIKKIRSPESWRDSKPRMFVIEPEWREDYVAVTQKLAEEATKAPV